MLYDEPTSALDPLAEASVQHVGHQDVECLSQYQDDKCLSQVAVCTKTHFLSDWTLSSRKGQPLVLNLLAGNQLIEFQPHEHHCRSPFSARTGRRSNPGNGKWIAG